MSRDNVSVTTRVPTAIGLGRGTPGGQRFLKAAAGSAALALALVLAAAPAHAATVTDFATCARLAEQTPADALPAAQAWLDHGGGDAARLCRAEALFLHGDFAPAGEVFEALATSSIARTPVQAANLYDRAGLSWLRAGDAARAEKLITTALERLPGDTDLLIDRALARAEGKRYREAIEDLSEVLKQAPRRAEIYLYRAEAWQALNRLDQALADADHVLTLKPGDGEALVLRGTLHALSGDATGARLDWREVIRREPDSANGKTAAERLSRLDHAPAEASPAGDKPAAPPPP
jgi:tetratricopeptide (TPR) repeat protein